MTPSTTEQGSATESPTAGPSGISRDLAIQLSSTAVPQDAVLVSAAAGRFADVYDTSNLASGYPVRPDQLVWAVKYESEFTICPPDGSPCWTPRPGWTTVILDFFTGKVLASPGVSPP